MPSEVTEAKDHLTTAHVNTELGLRGGERQVFRLIEGLRMAGHRAVLFCRPGSRCAEEATDRGIERITIPMRNHLALQAVPRLARHFRHVGVDVVHLHTGRATWLGGLAARAARLPALTTRRMDRPVQPGWRTRLTYERLVQRVIAISPTVAADLIAGGIARERVRVIPSAVEPAALQPKVPASITRTVLGAREDDHVLLALAALVPGKGIDLLVEALARLVSDGVRPLLWIAGSGPQAEELRARTAQLGLTGYVRFLGERDDAADLLAACDVFVTGSRDEGLGSAVLEALAAGCPVVATAVGGHRDVLQDGVSGLLVPPDDSAAFARALARILRDDALRARLAAAGPTRIASGFLAEQMVAAYDEVYREVVDEWRAR